MDTEKQRQHDDASRGDMTTRGWPWAETPEPSSYL